MNTYGVKPEGFSVVRKRVLLGGGVVLVLALLGAAFAIPSRDHTILPFGITAVIFFIIAGSVFSRNLRRLRETWSTYTLAIGEDFILKQQSHYPDIRINREEITTIQKAYTGELAVKTRNWRRFILIPRSLNGIEEVERLLSQWKPIVQYSKQKAMFAYSAGVLVLFGVLLAFRYFLSGETPSLSSLSLFVIIIMLLNIFGVREMRRFPNIDDRSKPKRWQFILQIGFLLLFVISLIVFHLFRN